MPIRLPSKYIQYGFDFRNVHSCRIASLFPHEIANARHNHLPQALGQDLGYMGGILLFSKTSQSFVSMQYGFGRTKPLTNVDVPAERDKATSNF